MTQSIKGKLKLPAYCGLQTLLDNADAVSGFEVCPTAREWTFRFPNGYTKKLGHIILTRRFASTISRHRVTQPPICTGHYAVEACIKWKVHKKKRHTYPPWFLLRDSGIRQLFAANVATHFDNTCNRDVRQEIEATDIEELWLSLKTSIREAQTCLEFQAKKDAPLSFDTSICNDTPVNLQALYRISSNRKRFNKFVREHEQQISELVQLECQVG